MDSGIEAVRKHRGEPLVVICQSEGIARMREELDKTGVRYGLIEMGVTPVTSFSMMWHTATVPCAHPAADLVSAVAMEYARLSKEARDIPLPKPLHYQELAPAVGF
ncbi:hypothetical protein JW707_03055 [Candidatus Woesearchaeota archaeon]|nr:hypothetical protein [Candidatus Woesearchaeota archaeon]